MALKLDQDEKVLLRRELSACFWWVNIGAGLRRHRQADGNVEANAHAYNMESWTCVILFTV